MDEAVYFESPTLNDLLLIEILEALYHLKIKCQMFIEPGYKYILLSNTKREENVPK